MTLRGMTSCFICCCLLLALGGCGNKGPLVLPEEDEKQKKTRSTSSY